MKQHGIFPLLLALALVLLSNRAEAWSSMASNTYQKTRHAEMAVKEYRQNTGKLPDAHHGWESLRKDSQSIYAELPDAFLDQWKRELIYRYPGRHGEFDIYSIGADGIDNQGELDDISNWNGVNEGYYWKKSWPLGRFVIIASCLLGILIFCAGSRIPRNLGRPLAGLVITVGVAFGSFCRLHPGVVPSRNAPLSLVIVITAFLSLVFLSRTWRNFRHFNL